FSGNALPAP
ncbi:hypothetical protein VCHC78A1_03332B, partial [Vibrio cholerae HC-78A1]